MNNLLLSLAKDSIHDELTHHNTINKDLLIKEYPLLKEARATFVTLTLHGELRGCIGSLIPHRALIDDLLDNAKSAAFKDPRFLPLTPEEFSKIEIEISLLTIPQDIEYTDYNDLKSKIRPLEDGVILSLYGNQSTFLPQVWEQLPDFDSFFNHLCQKAGCLATCLNEHPQIQTYQVEKITQ